MSMRTLNQAVVRMEDAVTIARAVEASPVTALRVWRQGLQARRLMLLSVQSRPRKGGRK